MDSYGPLTDTWVVLTTNIAHQFIIFIYPVNQKQLLLITIEHCQ